MKKRKIEIIYWKDIDSLSDTWKSKDELINDGKESFENDAFSIGEVLYENSNFVIVASTFDGDKKDSKYHDASMIMKSVITKRKILKYI